MKPLCDKCGQMLPDVRPFGITITDKTITRGDKTATLTRNEMTVFRTLIDAGGAVVSEDTFKHALYGDSRHASCNNILKVHISRLRKALAVLGIQIENNRGQGYRLKIPEATARAAAA